IRRQQPGITTRSLIGLTAAGPAASLTPIRGARAERTTEDGERPEDRSILNAGAALSPAELAWSPREALALASVALSGGTARETMAELAAFTEVFREEALQK